MPRASKICGQGDGKAGGDAAIQIEHCTFDASAALRVDNGGQSTTAFRHNTILENSLVPQSKDIADSRPVFEASGSSPAPKFFQGNRIYRGATEFNSKHWLIGGDSDAESNLLIGIRIKISAARNAGSVIRGNYLHLLMPINEEFPYYSQVSTVNPVNNLCEHNVIRDGEWIVRFVEGEFGWRVYDRPIEEAEEVAAHHCPECSSGRVIEYDFKFATLFKCNRCEYEKRQKKKPGHEEAE